VNQRTATRWIETSTDALISVFEDAMAEWDDSFDEAEAKAPQLLNAVGRSLDRGPTAANRRSVRP
jgi:hypothetical protein